MEAAVGKPLPQNTVDTFKAGDPNTVVTGVVTTFLPTMDVLRRAVAAGDNLIISHEPTFYNHPDDTRAFENDPVYREKRAYIDEHHLVIFRFHDGWHLRQPDGIVEGWIRKAGWKQYQSSSNQFLFTLPSTTVNGLAQQLQATFGARIIRIIGDPNMSVSHAAYIPGAGGEAKHVMALERPDVDVLVTGEGSEWEIVEYVRDAMLQGKHKAIILLGHDTSEEIGMQYCAEWLRPMFPGLRIDYIPAGEPYWLPGHPPASTQANSQ